MPYFDPDEEDEVKECETEKPESAIERLAVAIQRLADTKDDSTLFGNVMLNEIKSLDDSIRLTKNINILLLAAYSTLVAANSQKINNVLQPYNFAGVIEFCILFTPIMYWIASIGMLSTSHTRPPQNAELLNNKEIFDYLIKSYTRGFL
jgi:hypothetical protein